MVEPWIVLILAALSCFAGFAWLALAMNVHWQQVMETGSAPGAQARKSLRILGGLGLLVSAVFCFMADHPSMAVLVWLMLLAACASSVGMLLAWRPLVLRIFWPGGVSAEKAG
jgi:hypothetical protein